MEMLADKVLLSVAVAIPVLLGNKEVPQLTVTAAGAVIVGTI